MNKIHMSDLAELEEYYDTSLKNKRIDITIYCLTYNHIAYIRKTLDGFINQKIDKEIEVVIFDDASDDGTSDVIREYSFKHPELFHAIIAKSNTYRNQYRNTAWLNLLKDNARGKYAAICEGDDYWIYDYKLKRQYDLLESMPKVAMCYHNAIRYDMNIGEVVPQIIDMDSGVIDADEVFFASHGRPATASIMLRSEYICSLPHFFETSPVGDEPLRFWCAFNGDIYYLDKCWSVRNYMHEGSWNYLMKSDLNAKRQHNIKYMEFLDEYNRTTFNKFQSQIFKMLIGFCQSEFRISNVRKMNCEEFEDWCEQCKNIYGRKYEALFDYMHDCFVVCTKNYLENIVSSKGKIKVIYGAGNYGKKLKHLFESYGINVDMFCQTQKSDEETVVEGIPVIDLEHLKGVSESKQIFIAIGDCAVSYDVMNLLNDGLKEDDEIYQMRCFIEQFIK